jgi:hypothetical protein
LTVSTNDQKSERQEQSGQNTHRRLSETHSTRTTRQHQRFILPWTATLQNYKKRKTKKPAFFKRDYRCTYKITPFANNNWGLNGCVGSTNGLLLVVGGRNIQSPIAKLPTLSPLIYLCSDSGTNCFHSRIFRTPIWGGLSESDRRTGRRSWFQIKISCRQLLIFPHYDNCYSAVSSALPLA